MISSDEINKYAEVVFSYLKVTQNYSGQADLIMVFCSSDPRVAQFAAKLYNQKLAPKILFSGGSTQYRNPKLAKSSFNTEADMFKAEAEKLGVNKLDIIIEDQSTDSGGNIKFSYEKIQKLELNLSNVIIVHKPYMMRRVLAALEKQWPDKSTNFIPMCDDIQWSDYIEGLNSAQIKHQINTMVGDLDRITKYSEPEYNYQTYQKVPADVLQAKLKLMEAGYNLRLL